MATVLFGTSIKVLLFRLALCAAMAKKIAPKMSELKRKNGDLKETMEIATMSSPAHDSS